MDEIDEIAVERACYGDPVPLTLAERTVAVARLTARGLSSRQIAQLLGRSQRQICRYRRIVRLIRKAA